MHKLGSFRRRPTQTHCRPRVTRRGRFQSHQLQIVVTDRLSIGELTNDPRIQLSHTSLAALAWTPQSDVFDQGARGGAVWNGSASAPASANPPRTNPPHPPITMHIVAGSGPRRSANARSDSRAPLSSA